MSPAFLRRTIVVAKLLFLVTAVALSGGHGVLSKLIAFVAGLLCALLVSREARHAA